MLSDLYDNLGLDLLDQHMYRILSGLLMIVSLFVARLEASLIQCAGPLQSSLSVGTSNIVIPYVSNP